MRMENFTPFPNLRFYSSDNRGLEFGVLLVKGTYEIGADGFLATADTQAPLALTDLYHGPLNTSSVLMPSDIVPRKPRSDIIVNAIARAPKGQAKRSWTCSVAVQGEHRIEKRLRVTGPRFWEPLWNVSERARKTMSEAELRRVFRGWRLSEGDPVTEVPIRYELSYGGLLPRTRDGWDDPFLEPDERNPIGRGWIDPEETSTERAVPAPQIENAAEPVTSVYHRYPPEGFGAIPPAWLPRRPFGGTFDDNWRENVWPNWPADYDFAYHNSAHPDLIYPGLLQGDEYVLMTGLDGGSGERVIHLPGHDVTVFVDKGEDGTHPAPMELDTLFLDVADADPSRHRAHLTWRIAFHHDGVTALTFVLDSGSNQAERSVPGSSKKRVA